MKIEANGRATRIPITIILCLLAVGMLFTIRRLVRTNLNNPAAENRTGPVAKISVGWNGQIQVDGKDSTFAQLEPALERIKATDGTVWFYRAGGQENQSPEVMRVVKYVLSHDVPMSLSSKSDYSDYVDAKGASHPRKK